LQAVPKAFQAASQEQHAEIGKGVSDHPTYLQLRV
jgi:hypothetical protein